MWKVVASSFASLASLILGLAIPVAFPNAPQWIGEIASVSAIMLFILAGAFWFTGHRKEMAIAKTGLSQADAGSAAVLIGKFGMLQFDDKASDTVHILAEFVIKNQGPRSTGVDFSNPFFWIGDVKIEGAFAQIASSGEIAFGHPPKKIRNEDLATSALHNRNLQPGEIFKTYMMMIFSHEAIETAFDMPWRIEVGTENAFGEKYVSTIANTDMNPSPRSFAGTFPIN